MKQDYVLHDLIGEGCFGTVYSATIKSDPDLTVAAKFVIIIPLMLNSYFVYQVTDEESYLNEKEILTLLSGAQFEGIFQTFLKLFIYMNKFCFFQ